MRNYIREFNKILRYIFLAIAISGIAYFTYTTIKGEKTYLNYSFDGIVDQVSYDEKSIPNVIIKGKSYYLGSTSWNFNHLINKGDSIKKDSGYISVTLIKHSNGKKIVFDGN